MEAGGTGFSTVFRALSSKLFLLHEVTRWSISHLQDAHGTQITSLPQRSGRWFCSRLVLWSLVFWGQGWWRRFWSRLAHGMQWGVKDVHGLRRQLINTVFQGGWRDRVWSNRFAGVLPFEKLVNVSLQDGESCQGAFEVGSCGEPRIFCCAEPGKFAD